MLRYSYPGGLTPNEVPLAEDFEREVLPYTMKHGPQIGVDAMNGDPVAEDIIRRQRLFVEGVPEMRALNLRLLKAGIKLWERNCREKAR